MRSYVGFIMNNSRVISILLFIFSFVSAMGPEGFEFRRATCDDLNSLVCLMNEEAYQEEGIVVPPQKFRESYLRSAIDNGELFVISDGTKIVGYKKLFLMSDAVKRDSVLEEELRCIGSHAERLYRGVVSYEAPDIQFEKSEQSIPLPGNAAYIYTGVDFTEKSFRGRGLNNLLMRAALNAIQPNIIEYVN